MGDILMEVILQNWEILQTAIFTVLTAVFAIKKK